VYDLSPIVVTITESRRSFGHFITRLCAVLGGTFAVTGTAKILFRYPLHAFMVSLYSSQCVLIIEFRTDSGSDSIDQTGMLDKWMFRIIEFMTSSTNRNLL